MKFSPRFGIKMFRTLFFLSLTVSLTLAGHVEEDYSPDQQAYKFGYDIKDGHGNSQMRHEESDDWGNKKGSYGYTDAWGIYRIVDYVADKGGYRAWIRTNEPGTSNQDPASVKIQSEHPPLASNYKTAVAVPVYKSYKEPQYVQPQAVYSKAVVAASPVGYRGEPVYKRGYPVEEVYETKPKAFVYAPKRAGVRRIRKMKRISKPEYLPSYARANLASYGGFGSKIAKPLSAPANEELPLYKDKK